MTIRARHGWLMSAAGRPSWPAVPVSSIHILRQAVRDHGRWTSAHSPKPSGLCSLTRQLVLEEALQPGRQLRLAERLRNHRPLDIHWLMTYQRPARVSGREQDLDIGR